MANVIIIHGAYGNPEENWFPWLKSELEKAGHSVIVPEFPTPENQSLNNWLNVFRNYEKYLDENSIVIGHSLGVAFLLNVLEERNASVKASFFVAGFVGLLNIPDLDRINNTFANRQFNWRNIKQNSKVCFIFHSNDDPYVPLQKAKELEKNLEAHLTIVDNAGHFNRKSGYVKFELLLEKIKEVIKKLNNFN